MEKRIQLLQGIALEFSIRWDSMGFQQRMALAQVHLFCSKLRLPLAAKMCKIVVSVCLQNERSSLSILICYFSQQLSGEVKHNFSPNIDTSEVSPLPFR